MCMRSFLISDIRSEQLRGTRPSESRGGAAARCDPSTSRTRGCPAARVTSRGLRGGGRASLALDTERAGPVRAGLRSSASSISLPFSFIQRYGEQLEREQRPRVRVALRGTPCGACRWSWGRAGLRATAARRTTRVSGRVAQHLQRADHVVRVEPLAVVRPAPLGRPQQRPRGRRGSPPASPSAAPVPVARAVQCRPGFLPDQPLEEQFHGLLLAVEPGRHRGHAIGELADADVQDRVPGLQVAGAGRGGRESSGRAPRPCGARRRRQPCPRTPFFSFARSRSVERGQAGEFCSRSALPRLARRRRGTLASNSSRSSFARTWSLWFMDFSSGVGLRRPAPRRRPCITSVVLRVEQSSILVPRARAFSQSFGRAPPAGVASIRRLAEPVGDELLHAPSVPRLALSACMPSASGRGRSRGTA